MNDDANLALLTDLYQLTMAESYFRAGKLEPATFSLFIRSYPRHRGYFVVSGLHDVLQFLEQFAFGEREIDYLHSIRLFSDDFLEFLRRLEFTGEVWAIPEGRVCFKDEPLLEVTAPIIEAQLVETFIINQVNLQSLIATKAARCVEAARGRSVVDFSLRRTHGIDAGMKVARASYLAGFAGTSNVRAGQRYGIPVLGTMAHSYVSSFAREIDAFRCFVASFPHNSTLLIDTYDTIAAAHLAVEVGREMAARGDRLQGVRIDSGNLAELATAVRRIFDTAGMPYVKIIGSGGLDEYDLEEFSAAGAPFDSYGVGTKMGVSADAPWFDIAYKLVEHAGRPVMKFSPGKISWPGKKQVFRRRDAARRFERDTIGLRDEALNGTEPLLEKVMAQGKILGAEPSLAASRERLSDDLGKLSRAVRAIREAAAYPMEFTPRLRALLAEVEQRVANGGESPSHWAATQKS